jgi:hypothetical protein
MDREKILSMDSNILLSWINTKLRDKFADLEDLCREYDLEEDEVKDKLKAIGYSYNKDSKQFKIL